MAYAGMICPNCRKELGWVGDEDDGERAWGHYSCNPCNITVFAYFEDLEEEDQDDS